jgi:sulfotransferase family protein
MTSAFDLKHAVSRSLLLASLAIPPEPRARILRWQKGLRERRSLAGSDVVVLSFPKSGRTWFRVMLSRVYAITYGLDRDAPLDGANFHRREPRVPSVFFTHGNYRDEMSRGRDLTAMFAPKKIIFLVRHPADAAVSLYFHNLGGRVDPIKRRMKRMPESMEGISVGDFVLDPRWGVPAVIAYLNFWRGFLAHCPHTLMVRYEDLRTDPQTVLERIAAFLGETFPPRAVAEAIESSSLERLREQERRGDFKSPVMRMRDPSDPNSVKVRRGKMGGYVDYLDAAQVATIERLITDGLDPAFGYGSQATVVG